MKLEEKLVKLRKQFGLSQEELADKLGISRQTLYCWELGTIQPDSANLLELSKFYGVTVEYLLHDDLNIDSERVEVTEKPREMMSKKKIKLLLLIAFVLWLVAAIANFAIAMFNFVAVKTQSGILHIALTLVCVVLSVFFAVKYIRMNKYNKK